MEYRGIDIDMHRERFYSKIPTDSHSSRGRDVLESKASVRICVFGIPALDEAFPFELRAILEEFIGRKLGQTSGPLNSNPKALGHAYVLSIHREEAQLVMSLEDPDTGKRYVSKFGMIHAKTLYAILTKAIQAITI